MGGSVMAGNGGESGSTGGTGDIPDGGLSDGGDALAPLVGRPAFATAICARFEEVPDPCNPAAADCVEANVAAWDDIEVGFPACGEEIDAYFGCMADEPIESFICEGDTNNPGINIGNHGCVTEETAFFAGFGDNCGEP
jgi:hypothetical protein